MRDGSAASHESNSGACAPLSLPANSPRRDCWIITPAALVGVGRPRITLGFGLEAANRSSMRASIVDCSSARRAVCWCGIRSSGPMSLDHVQKSLLTLVGSLRCPAATASNTLRARSASRLGRVRPDQTYLWSRRPLRSLHQLSGPLVRCRNSLVHRQVCGPGDGGSARARDRLRFCRVCHGRHDRDYQHASASPRRSGAGCLVTWRRSPGGRTSTAPRVGRRSTVNVIGCPCPAIAPGWSLGGRWVFAADSMMCDEQVRSLDSTGQFLTCEDILLSASSESDCSFQLLERGFEMTEQTLQVRY